MGDAFSRALRNITLTDGNFIRRSETDRASSFTDHTVVDLSFPQHCSVVPEFEPAALHNQDINVLGATIYSAKGDPPGPTVWASQCLC